MYFLSTREVHVKWCFQIADLEDDLKELDKMLAQERADTKKQKRELKKEIDETKKNIKEQEKENSVKKEELDALRKELEEKRERLLIKTRVGCQKLVKLVDIQKVWNYDQFNNQRIPWT